MPEPAKKGRCPGCGMEGNLKRVRQHIVGCSQAAELMASNPADFLDPDKEYERHKLATTSDEAKTERRGKKLTKLRADSARRLSRQKSRWGQ